MYKTAEEYSKEMTREEFDKFTELEDICPSALALENSEEGYGCKDCSKCWNAALIGITFLPKVPGFPKETIKALMHLQDLEVAAKKIETEQKALKEELLKAMEEHGIKKWDNDVMTVTYTAPTTRVSVDSTKLKKSYPQVFDECQKVSNVKSSIRIKLKEGK